MYPFDSSSSCPHDLCPGYDPTVASAPVRVDSLTQKLGRRLVGLRNGDSLKKKKKQLNDSTPASGPITPLWGPLRRPKAHDCVTCQRVPAYRTQFSTPELSSATKSVSERRHPATADVVSANQRRSNSLGDLMSETAAVCRQRRARTSGEQVARPPLETSISEDTSYPLKRYHRRHMKSHALCIIPTVPSLGYSLPFVDSFPLLTDTVPLPSDRDKPRPMRCFTDIEPTLSAGGGGGLLQTYYAPEEHLKLVEHTKNFADALLSLKRVFQRANCPQEMLVNSEVDLDSDQEKQWSSYLHKAAIANLSHVVDVIKNIFEQFPTTNSSLVMHTIMKVMLEVRNCNYRHLLIEFRSSTTTTAGATTTLTSSPVPVDTSKAIVTDNVNYCIDKLASAFDFRLSEILQGDVDTFPLLRQSVSQENLITSSQSESYTEEEVFTKLEGLKAGMDIAFDHAKSWTKYAKEISCYVDKRNALLVEYTKKLVNLATGLQTEITNDGNNLLFRGLHLQSLDRDIKHAQHVQKSWGNLQSKEFVQLNNRRLDHERKRKLIKDSYFRCLRKMTDASANVKSARKSYENKKLNLQAASKLYHEVDLNLSSSSSSTHRKRKGFEDAQHKTLEADRLLIKNIEDARETRKEYKLFKKETIAATKELVCESDQIMKDVTYKYFSGLYAMYENSPAQILNLREQCADMQPGSGFFEYIQNYLRQVNCHPDDSSNVEDANFDSIDSRRLSHSSESGSDILHHHEDSDSLSGQSYKSMEYSCQKNMDEQGLGLGPIPAIVSNCGSMDDRHECSEFYCSGHHPHPQHPHGSHGAGAAGLLSADSDYQHHFRGVRLSPASRTHSLRKLRTPSRCHHCSSFVYFHGAECRRCGLTSHKKCLEVLAHMCQDTRHGDLNALRRGSRMTTFGVPIANQTKRTMVPYLVRRCIEEIDKFALELRGIYRVSAVKSRVEALCQKFETSEDNVDLADYHSHVIANVLKLYLRQLPEPLLTFTLYPQLIQLAKDELNKTISSTSEQFFLSLKSLIFRLPKPNFQTCGVLMRHLNIVAQNESENQMSASNLGIVFGPTLLRNRPKEEPFNSLHQTLEDTPCQTRLIELMIVNMKEIFFPDLGDDLPDNQAQDNNDVRIKIQPSDIKECECESVPEEKEETFVQFNDTSDSPNEQSSSSLDNTVAAASSPGLKHKIHAYEVTASSLSSLTSEPLTRPKAYVPPPTPRSTIVKPVPTTAAPPDLGIVFHSLPKRTTSHRGGNRLGSSECAKSLPSLVDDSIPPPVGAGGYDSATEERGSSGDLSPGDSDDATSASLTRRQERYV